MWEGKVMIKEGGIQAYYALQLYVLASTKSSHFTNLRQ